MANFWSAAWFHRWYPFISICAVCSSGMEDFYDLSRQKHLYPGGAADLSAGGGPDPGAAPIPDLPGQLLHRRRSLCLHGRLCPGPAALFRRGDPFLEPGDFDFEFAEARAEIPVNAALPCFVFVQTGNGQKGVIRVESISPESTEMIAGVVYPANPSVVMDIKFPRTYSEQQIR